MRVLVTGGAGFIGSALVRHIVGNLGWDATNLDKLTYAASADSLASVRGLPRYRLVRADICDAVAVDKAIWETNPAAIIHLAAESHVDRSITGSSPFIKTNILGTYTVLEVARKFWNTLRGSAKRNFRFLHVSTDEVYGSVAAPHAFTEASKYDPRSPYSASKAASDHLVRAWHETYGLPTVITNCSNNYGPFQFPEKLIPLTLLNAIDGKPLPVYGDGRQVRDWLFVDDHVRALTLALERGVPGHTYTIGGRAERENIEVVRTLCDILDDIRPRGYRSSDLVTHVADRPGHDRRYAIDPSRIERELDWHPMHSFESGLRATVAWYLENESWWRPLRKHVYAGQRLGLGTYASPPVIPRPGDSA